MVHFTGLLENARHPVAGLLLGDFLSLDFCKNRVRAGIGGWPGTATGGQIHVVHISHTHPPKELIQALRKYLLGKKRVVSTTRVRCLKKTLSIYSEEIGARSAEIFQYINYISE